MTHDKTQFKCAGCQKIFDTADAHTAHDEDCPKFKQEDPNLIDCFCDCYGVYCPDCCPECRDLAAAGQPETGKPNWFTLWREYVEAAK